MLEQTEWGEFKLKDLFDITNTLSFNIDKLTEGNEYDYITRTSFNQWILQSTWFVNQENINEAWVWSLWLLQMDFFYRKKPWYAGQFVRKIVPKFKLSQGSILFFSAILNCQKKVLLSVLIRHLDETFKSIKIRLPTQNWKPDFEFMNKFIAELEATHQAELEAYLRMTWLKNYELTSSELELLKVFEEWKIEWWKFQIWSENWLFEIKHYWKQRSQEDLQRDGEKIYNFVMQNDNHNGVVEKVPEQIGNNFNLIPWNSISAFTHLNKVYYQETPFYSKQWSNVYSLRNSDLNKMRASFLISSINKRIWSIWYGKNTASRLETYKIELPIKNWKPDYELMEKFIWAIQKLVIKDVAIYNEIKLKTNKEIINR